MGILNKSIGVFIILILANMAYSQSSQEDLEEAFKGSYNLERESDFSASMDELKKVYEIHFNADVAYLQADYKRAFKRVYSSQGEMVKMYRNVLKDIYLEDSKNILDKIAPGIIRSKNARARLFLTLGYRDRTVSWTHYTVAEASNPKLFSYKIYKYEEGIKLARRAKRYGFLALFESQDAESKREIYHQLLKNEKKEGMLFYNRFLDIKEKEFIKQLGKSYEEHQTELENKKSTEGSGTEPKTFEKKVEKRVRFRNEERTARFLLNTEFDKAEDIIRKYVDDFNFKLISAVFDVLSSKNGKEKQEADKIEYKKFRVHLIDNYTRLIKDSLLDSIVGTVKVEDDIEADKKEKKETDADDRKVEKTEKNKDDKEKKVDNKDNESNEKK